MLTHLGGRHVQIPPNIPKGNGKYLNMKDQRGEKGGDLFAEVENRKGVGLVGGAEGMGEGGVVVKTVLYLSTVYYPVAPGLGIYLSVFERFPRFL